MIDKLLEAYNQGAITVDHLIAECLRALDPNDPGLVLQALPQNVLERTLRFVRDYRPGEMQSNYGLPPTNDQIEAARRWIEDKARQSA